MNAKSQSGNLVKFCQDKQFTSLGVLPRCLRLFSLDLLLDFGLFIELVEVVDNNGDGEGDAEDSTDGAHLAKVSDQEDRKTAHRSYKLSKPSDGIDVAVAHRRHRDDRPVQGLEQQVILIASRSNECMFFLTVSMESNMVPSSSFSPT